MNKGAQGHSSGYHYFMVFLSSIARLPLSVYFHSYMLNILNMAKKGLGGGGGGAFALFLVDEVLHFSGLQSKRNFSDTHINSAEAKYNIWKFS